MKFKILKASAFLFFLSFFLSTPTKAEELNVFFVDTVLSKTEVVSLGSKKVVMMLFEVKGPASANLALDTIQTITPPTELPKKLFFTHWLKDDSDIQKLSSFTSKPVTGVGVYDKNSQEQSNGTVTFEQIKNKDGKPYLAINGVFLNSSDIVPVAGVFSSAAQALPVFKTVFDFFGVKNSGDVKELPGNFLLHDISKNLQNFSEPQAMEMALSYNIAYSYWNDNWYSFPNAFEKLSANITNNTNLAQYMWNISRTKSLEVFQQKIKGLDAGYLMDLLPHPLVYNFAIKEFGSLTSIEDKKDFLYLLCIEGGCYSDEKLKDFFLQALKFYDTIPQRDKFDLENIEDIKIQLNLMQKRESNHLYDLPTLMKYIEKLDKSDEYEDEIYESQRIVITGTFVEKDAEEFNTYILETKIGEYKVLVNFVASVEDVVNVKKGDTVTVSGLIDMVMFDEDEDAHTKEIEIDLLLSEVSKK